MYEYDVALSFAGENREYVREIAKKLKSYRFRLNMSLDWHWLAAISQISELMIVLKN